VRQLLALVMATALSGCATYNPIPEGYTGPVATVTDSGGAEDGSKAKLFALMDIDGNRIMNSFWASANASHGRGFALTVVISERQVPAKPMKAMLKASHTTAAPIHAIASRMAGTFFSVEGVVDFSPRSGGRYVVRGELNKGGSTVWIEDAETGQPVTQKVVEQKTAE